MTTSKKFDAAHYYELLEMAYNSRNYDEAYRYATTIIENEPEFKAGQVWAYKGYTAGLLSTPANPRILEMINYLEKAKELGIDVNWIGISASLAIIQFVKKIRDIFNSNQDNYASENRTSNVAIPRKSVSESFGAGLGTGIANGMADSSNRKEAAKNNGVFFRTKFEAIVMDGLNYAWSVSPSKDVAKNIEVSFSNIILATGLDKKSKDLFLNSSANQLIDEVKQKHPEFKLPEIPGDGCCFIASAVIGDHNHPDVIALKQFRDIVLKNSNIGIAFIVFYYHVSPPLSRFVRNKNQLRILLYHYLIKPTVYYARWALNKKISIQRAS